VKSGDSLSVLAENHGITTKELMALNSLKRKQINIGQRLRIPKRVENKENKLEGSEDVLAKAESKSGDLKKEESDKLDSKNELIKGVNGNKEIPELTKAVAEKTKKADQKLAKAPN
jgi:LysM repeat protein